MNTDAIEDELRQLEAELSATDDPVRQCRIALMIASRRHELEARQWAEQP